MVAMTKLFVNGKIWQWGAAPAQWMRVDATGAIAHVGSPATTDSAGKPTLMASAVDEEEVVDLAGALVLPGLHDSHIHAYFMGESAEFLNLTGCSSFEDFNERLRKYDAQYPDKTWIVGFGWEQDKLSMDARYPTRFDLDAAVTSGRPVMLHRACWHIAVVNTKALEIAGVDINKTTSHGLVSGTIDVDARGATGILREAAVELVTKHTNEKSDVIRIKYLRNALAKCVRHGLTGIHTNDDDAWRLYTQIQQESGLPLRVYLTPLISELMHKDTASSSNPMPAPGSRDGLLSCDRIKVFSDGSLGAETAALRQPYKGTSNMGILMDTNEKLIEKVSRAHAAGYRLEIHAIGDRAAEQVLMALKESGVPRESRPILTHCQILGADLIPKMEEQGVIGNIQPSFTITDASFARKRLPEAMIPYSYCWKTMIDSGVVCAGGSDAPIETCNPFQGMYDAIYRRKPDAPEEDVYLPNERLSFEQALEIYTKNGAYAAMEEHHLGQLASGFTADFVVLRRDVTQDHAALLDADLVQSVWVNGNKTFQYDAQKAAVEKEADFSQSSLPGKNGQIRICRCCRHTPL